MTNQPGPVPPRCPICGMEALISVFYPAKGWYCPKHDYLDKLTKATPAAPQQPPETTVIIGIENNSSELVKQLMRIEKDNPRLKVTEESRTATAAHQPPPAETEPTQEQIEKEVDRIKLAMGDDPNLDAGYRIAYCHAARWHLLETASLRKSLDEIRKDRDKWIREAQKTTRECLDGWKETKREESTLRAENERLRAGLKFYRDKWDRGADWTTPHVDLQRDQGHIAEQALAAADNQGEDKQ